MAPLSPDPTTQLAPLLVTLCSGVLMTKAGFAKNMLTFRRPEKRCASCGLLRSHCRCQHN